MTVPANTSPNPDERRKRPYNRVTADHPIAVSEKRGAALLDVSPSLYRKLEKAGEIRTFQIPGTRRKLADVEDLRATMQRWKARP